MGMRIEYGCTECGLGYFDEDEAQDCCESGEAESYAVCEVCSEEYKTEQEAIDCHPWVDDDEEEA
jgi:hypothetical protein